MSSQNNRKICDSGRMLLSLEKEGLSALRSGDYRTAIRSFSKIVEQMPSFEHGMIYYHLACALEELGEIENADANYRQALDYCADDVVRLGGYASFLYLYRDPADAFDTFLKLLRLQLDQGEIEISEKSVIALKTLGERLGWSEQETIDHIQSRLTDRQRNQLAL